MAYTFILGDVQFPITPSKLDIKIKNNNKTVNLINEGDINILKLPGLTEISFDVMIPQVQYPFANELKPASFFLNKFENFKVEKKPIRFIVTRIAPSGKMLFDNNMNVSLEEYTVKEDSKNGFDLMVTVKLKQFKEYGTKIIKIVDSSAKTENVRSSDSAKTETTETTYKVESGDCLWNIAKKYYGDGSKYLAIYEANKDKITNPNMIYPGQVLIIPSAESVKNFTPTSTNSTRNTTSGSTSNTTSGSTNNDSTNNDSTNNDSTNNDSTNNDSTIPGTTIPIPTIDIQIKETVRKNIQILVTDSKNTKSYCTVTYRHKGLYCTRSISNKDFSLSLEADEDSMVTIKFFPANGCGYLFSDNGDWTNSYSKNEKYTFIKKDMFETVTFIKW